MTCPTAGISNFTLSGVVSIAETVKVYSEKSNAADPITGTTGSSISWAVGVGALTRTYWPDKLTAYAVVDASFEAPYNYPNTQVYVEEVATDNLYVDDNPSGDATPPMLIQTAVTFAAAGKTVFLESGTYNEQVAVNKSLTIEGNTGVATDVVLDANNKISGGGTGFSIQANNVSIKDLTVREYELGVAVAAPGYNAITIDNAVLTENFSSGFYSNQSISGLTINLSTLSNNNGGGFRRGVFLQSSSANFTNIFMTGNTVTGNGLVGLDINLNNTLQGLTITGNTLTGNGDAAIGVWLGKTTTASAPVVVSGNTITIPSTARFGIEIKNPNATGLSSGTGSVVLQNNNVSLVSIADSDRDLAGLAIIRRKDNDAGINDIPKGVYVASNTFASFKNIGAGDGFGLAAGGRDHSFINNTINNNDIGIQTQAGNSPTDSNNSDQNATDLYFGRDNSQELCNITITPLFYAGNTTDERIVTGGVPGTIQTAITPTVVDPADQVLCTGLSTTAVNFTGNVMTGKVYNWTNDNTSIGLAASGTGGISSFTTLNTTNTVQVATITVTPVANGCSGTPQTFTISVKPTPTVDDPANQVVCNGINNTAVNFASTFNVAGTTYAWTADANAVSIGYAANGSTSTPSFAAVNNTNAPITGTITVTPTADGCPGTPQTFTVTVNPTPTVDDPADQVVCNGFNTTAVNFASVFNVSGTTYTWTADANAVSIGYAASGNTSTPSFAAVNNSNAPVIGTITVTPSANGCPGAPQSFTVTVNPTPAVPTVDVDNNCDGTATLTASGYTGTLLWSTSETTPSITVNANGTYTVTQTELGCSSLAGSGLVTLLTNSGTWYVNATTGNDNNIGSASCPVATVGKAIMLASNTDVINVAAGTYTGNIIVNKSVTLRGAKVGVDCNGRTGAETNLVGTGDRTIYVQADGVTIDGFTISNPTGNFGIFQKGQNNMLAQHNIVTNIGNATSGSGASYGIAIEMGSAANMSNVNISNNCVSDIRGGNNTSLSGLAAKANNGSGVAIGAGFSNANFDINSLTISCNTINNISASALDFNDGGKGAYGVLINVGASAGGVGKANSPLVSNNTITILNGLWSHGIGLEGETPGASVVNNTMSAFTHNKPSDPDAVGVMVEQNAGAATVAINQNSFTGIMVYGVKNVTGTSVNAESNYYDVIAAALVAAKNFGVVDYTPWLLTSSDLSASCGFQPILPATGTPVLMSIATNTPASCVGGPNNGALTTNTNGGTAPYSYIWSNGTMTADISAVGAGTYTVTVTDANMSQATATATVIFLPVTNTTSGLSYATIQAAIDVAANGDDIYVCNGTYLEDVDVNKPNLTIEGQSRSGTIIKGLYTTGGVATLKFAGTGADGSTVKNMTISRDYQDWYGSSKNYGISLSGGVNSITLQNLRVVDNRNGVYVENNAQINMYDCLIEQNRTGIQITNTVRGNVHNNIIRDNQTHGVFYNLNDGTSNLTNFSFNDNKLTGNWYSQVTFRGSNTLSPLANFECNYFETNAPVINTSDPAEPGYGVIVPQQLGGVNPGVYAEPLRGNGAIYIDYVNWRTGQDVNISDPFVPSDICNGTPVVIASATSTPNQYCQNNGTITINFSGGLTPYTVSWIGTSTGGPVAYISGTPFGTFTDGTYTLTVSGMNGSTASTMVSVSNLPVRNNTGPTYHATIQDAINTATAGNIIDVCAGTYTETINIDKALTINGPNMGIDPNTGIRVAEAIISNSVLQVTSSTSPVIIDGFRIEKSGTNTSHGVDLSVTPQATVVTVQNNYFNRDVTVTGSFALGVYLAAANLSAGLKTVRNNLFTGLNVYGSVGSHRTWRAGIWANGGNLTVEDNVFDFVNTALNLEIDATGYIVEGNTFKRVGTAMSFGIPVAQSVTFGANEFKSGLSGPNAYVNLGTTTNAGFRLDITAGTVNGMVFSTLPLNDLFLIEFLMWHRGRASRNGLVTYVTNNQYVIPTNPGIQLAVDYAATGGTINIASNTTPPAPIAPIASYVAGINVAKSLTIQGAGCGSTIIDGGGTALNGIKLTSATTFVTIRNLTIQNTNGGSDDAGIRAVAGCDDLLIEDVCIVNTPGRGGIYVDGPVDGVTIDDCEVSGTGVNGRGITVWNGFKENITITGNNVHDIGGCCGIELQDGDASGVTMDGNTVMNVGDSGMSAIGLNGSTGANSISGNTITGGGRFGIEIKNPAGGVTVSNNSVSLTTVNADLRDRAGIAVFRRGVLNNNVDVPNGVTVTNNTVTGYLQTLPEEGFGIVIEGTNHTVTGNTISNCNVGIQQQGGSHANAFYPNITGPYGDGPGNGAQGVGLSPNYFGRGNSPFACGNDISGNFLTGNGAGNVPRNVISATNFGLVTNTDSGETFCNIQAAIDDAQTVNGHTLTVVAGTYAETINLNKSVTLRGPNHSLVPCVDTRVAEAIITGGLNVTAGITMTVVIEGFHFQGVSSPFNYNGNIGTTTLTATFRNNLVNSSSGQMAAFVGATDNANLTISNNCFQNMASNAMQLGGGNFVTQITGNIINTTVNSGINTDAIVNSNISNNTISNTGQQGIQVAGFSSNVNVFNNVITNANTTLGVDRGGIRIRGTNYTGPVDISNNIISGSLNGIAVANGENITGKTILVNDNKLDGNTSSIYHGGMGSLNAECNWHGLISANAISAQLGGSGASNIDFVSYLTSNGDGPGFGFQPTGTCNGTPVVITNVTTTPVLCGPTVGNIAVTFSGGNGTYTIAWAGPSSGGPVAATSIHTITPLTAGTYTVTVSDTNGSSATTTATIQYLPVTNITDAPNTYYATIQAAIDAATTTDGEVINVCAGTYVENIVVNKELDIRGANYNVNPNTGSRGSESILMTSVIEVAGTNNSRIVAVDANNVKINGFLLDGNNPALTSGFTNNVGADMDIRNGIDNAKGIQNLRVENNIIKNMVYYGVRIQSTTGLSPAVSSGHEIHNNRFMDMGTYQTVPSGWGLFGGGVLLQNSHYAKITNNVMLNVRIGVQLGNFQAANPNGLFVHSIDNNQIQARRIGIFYNLLRYSPWTVANNSITGYSSTDEGTIGGSWRGLRITSVGLAGMGNSLFNNNSINGSAISNINKEGINVWNVTNNSQPIITGGSITGVNTGAILVNHDAGFGNAADGANATLNNVNITATGIGVHLLDSPSSTTHAKVNATVSGVTISGGVEGIKLEQTAVAGAEVGGSFTNNSISAAAVGINVTRAALSATNPLTITGNNVTVSNQVIGMTPTAGISLTNVTGSAAATIGTNIIAGPFYGYGIFNLNTSPVTSINGGTITGVMQGVAGSNLYPPSTLAPSTFNVDGITMSAFAGDYPSLPDVNFHAGVYTFTGGPSGANTITSTISNVNISGTGKIAADCAGLSFADFSTAGSTMQNITVNTSTINNNLNRGVNVRGSRAMVSINTSTLQGNGSDAYATGGNPGFTFIAHEGANLTVSNNFIEHPATSATSVTAFLTGNGTGNTIVAHNNSVLMNGNVANGRRASNNAGSTINATCNWWGPGACPADLISGVVSVYPYLTNGTDDSGAAGFQPVAGSCSEPSIKSTVTSPVGPYNQMMNSGNSYTLTICSGQEVTTSAVSVVNAEAANCSSLRVRTVYTTTITTLPPTQTFDQAYSVASLLPPTSITPENHDGVAKDIVFVSTPYYDVNGNNQYDAGIDAVGGTITFTLTVQPTPKINFAVTADGTTIAMESGVIGTSASYAATICSGELVTSTAAFSTSAAPGACGPLMIQTSYVTTIGNIFPQNYTAYAPFLGNVAPAPITPQNLDDVPKDIVFTTTPYYEVDGMPGLTGGDVVGDYPVIFTLTVQPAPKITCPPSVQVNNDPGLCSAVVAYSTPTFIDFCPTSTIVQTAGLTSGSIFPVGVTTNTWQITDGATPANTSTCTFTVTVIDNTPPTYTIPAMGASVAGYTCGATINRFTDPASCNSFQTIVEPVWADNCVITATTATANNSVTLTDLGAFVSGTFPKGSTIVTFTATDASGNTTTCSITIVVSDNIPPVFSSLPTSFTVAAPPGDCSLIVNWVPPVANDNCPGTVTVTSNFNPGTVFNVPTALQAPFMYTITYTATDQASNVATYSFVITVTGNCIPAVDLSVQTPQFALDPPGDFTLPVVKHGVITVKNNGVNATHTLAPLENVKVLVGVPSSTVFTSVAALSPENDGWIITEHPSSPPGVKMYLFALDPLLSIAPGASKTIRIRVTPVGYIGQKGVITAQLYNGSGGDVSPNNNYTQGSFQIAN